MDLLIFQKPINRLDLVVTANWRNFVSVFKDLNREEVLDLLDYRSRQQNSIFARARRIRAKIEESGAEATPEEEEILLRVEKLDAKEKARGIGLKYWPALLAKDTNVDPRAFVVAEKTLRALLPENQRAYWGETAPDGQRSHGGWDSWSHYGLSAHPVAYAWKLAGCRENRKFHALLRALYRVNSPYHARSGGKSASASRVEARMRGFLWAQRNRLHLCAYAAQRLGKLTAPLRWAACARAIANNVPFIRATDLDWEEVARIQKKRGVARLEHCPTRTVWEHIVPSQHAFPAGARISKDVPHALVTKTGAALLATVEINRADRLENVLAVYTGIVNLVKVFGRDVASALRTVAQERAENDDNVRVLHDFGQFTVPTDLPSEMLAFAKKHFVAIGARFGYLAKLTEVPRSIEHFARLIIALRAQDIIERCDGDENLAIACTMAMDESAEFDIDHYKQWLTSHEARSEEETLVPRLSVGNIVAFDKCDKRAPLLGIYTKCCQHPDGAAKSVAAKLRTSRRMRAFALCDSTGQISTQSAVWITKDRSMIVFDSIEGRRSANDIRQWRALAEKLLEATSATVAVVGKSYGAEGLARDLQTEDDAVRPETCPSSYSDAEKAFVIARKQ